MNEAKLSQNKGLWWKCIWCMNECVENLFFSSVHTISFRCSTVRAINAKKGARKIEQWNEIQHALRIASSTWHTTSDFWSYIFAYGFFFCFFVVVIILFCIVSSWQRIYLFDVCINLMLIKIPWDLLSEIKSHQMNVHSQWNEMKIIK